MRVIRAFVDAPLAAGATLALPDSAAGHLLRVLRLREGDGCVLFNGDGYDYDARIAAAGKRDARVEILGARAVANESPLRIVLLQALARGEKMDWIVQKATELGVAAIVPATSERSEVKLDAERAGKRTAHLREVAIAACEQSGRARIPVIAAPAALATALAALPRADARYVLDPEAGASTTGLALPAENGAYAALTLRGVLGWTRPIPAMPPPCG